MASRVASRAASRVASRVAPRVASKVAPRVVSKVASRVASKVASRVAPRVASKVASRVAPRVASKVAPRDELLRKGYEIATFAAGCFWRVESIFRKVKGVKFTQVGYTGGKKENPTYKEVCTGKTGHAEAVEIVFNPAVVPYEKLLELFWEMHDPTSLNRQGPDIGTQYRSAIFYHSPEQRHAAIVSKTDLEKSGKYDREIVTQILPAGPFYRAEEYHQQYFERMGKDDGRIIKH